jgi:hypothetical protein
MGFSIRNAEYVEVLFPAAPKQQTFFPDLPNLRNRPITGMEVYSALEQSYGQSGNAVISGEFLKDAYFVAYFDGGEYIQVPLQSLHRISTATGNTGNNVTYFDIPQLAGQNIVWTKSYVFITNTTNLTTNWQNRSLVFNVYYNR